MEANEILARVARLPGVEAVEQRTDGVWLSAPEIDVAAMARTMAELECRLCTMTALALPDGEATILYHYARPGLALNFRARTRGGAMPSLAAHSRPAWWIEREIHDLYAVDFVGHPNLEPLLRPPGLREGFFRDESGGGTATPAAPGAATGA